MSRFRQDSPFAFWKPSRRRRLVRYALIFLIIAVVVGALVAFFQRDQPPGSFTIATGPPGSASYLAAENYRRIAQENDFDLEIVTSEDVVERLDMLLTGEAQVGFIPSGAATGLETDELRTLASVYYEPLWIFYRRALAPDEPFDDLQDLRGMRIALGPDSVSTERLARSLLGLNGITEENVTLVDLDTAGAIDGLRDGRVDAAFFVGAATEDLLLPLLRDPALDIMSVRRALAYANRYRFLTTIDLPEGAIDLEENLPSQDKRLLSAVATIVIRHDLHPDLIRLMTIALVDTHEPGGLFEEPFEFPRADLADLPISREYLAYLEQIRSGESQLDNIFPFRIAALIDRISWIAGLSMAGYWALRLYLNGILPVISFPKMLAIYIGLVAMIFVPTYFIHGWPTAERWYEVLYPFIGVAFILGFYSLVAYLGKRRLEHIGAQ